jgi:hypothetical protein
LVLGVLDSEPDAGRRDDAGKLFVEASGRASYSHEPKEVSLMRMKQKVYGKCFMYNQKEREDDSMSRSNSLNP